MAGIAEKYAQALFDVSQNTNNIEDIYNEYTIVNDIAKTEVTFLKAMDEDPTKTVNDREAFVTTVFGSVNPYLKNMFMLLADHRHLGLIADVYAAYVNIYNMHHNQDFARVESTYALSDAELEGIKRAFISRTGLNDIIVSNVINPSLIGGIRVKLGTKVYDSSIQNDLSNLEKVFSRVN